ncbi:Aminopeptidase YwaD [Orchesella cincta]|uniref:Aminopeptidase YwaD n=1 Tax=Orchesella cincta TaxID=48709 RepID=A0A1D2NIT0_ORCCI|nr:Aminopeptidase YwaD [Orchesella cincta]
MHKSLFTCALWSAVVAGAVLGILTEPEETEVFDSNPDILREQLVTWSNEFFSTGNYRGRLSKLEELTSDSSSNPSSSNPYYSYSHESSSGVRGGSDSSGRYNTFRGRLHSAASAPASTKLFEGADNSRINTRYHDVSRSDVDGKPVIKGENLEWMLQNIFMYPRNHATNESAKEIARKYIVDSLQVTSGLHTTAQHFQPLQFLSMYEGQSVPMGTNIIGIIKGSEWGTPNDLITVVGAHWDTVNFTPGTDDNGSGVAAMLEAARAIAHSNCRPKYSIIFVAFDLEEVGSQGSLVFIKDYLMEILKSNFPNELGVSRFQGAFIMDTIMNFNDTDGSQIFPTEWSLALPEVYDQIADNQHRGDFLSMIYRRDVDKKMAARFQYHWDKSTVEPRFRLTPFPLRLTAELPPMEVLADHLNFLRSDHSRFWYMNDSSVPTTLNAVLMTDTGPYRGNMKRCYHSVCDGPEVSLYSNPRSLKFLTKITQVLTDTLGDMSECQYTGNSNPNSQRSNFIKTNRVHARSSAFKHGSPLRNLFNFVRWMHNTGAR